MWFFLLSRIAIVQGKTIATRNYGVPVGVSYSIVESHFVWTDHRMPLAGTRAGKRQEMRLVNEKRTGHGMGWPWVSAAATE